MFIKLNVNSLLGNTVVEYGYACVTEDRNVYLEKKQNKKTVQKVRRFIGEEPLCWLVTAANLCVPDLVSKFFGSHHVNLLFVTVSWNTVLDVVQMLGADDKVSISYKLHAMCRTLINWWWKLRSIF